MATSQPTNRDITADTAIDAPAGSTFLGVTPDKRVALFNLPDIDVANGALRFNQTQQLSEDQKRLVLQNIGLDEVDRLQLPEGGSVGQILVRTASGYAWGDAVAGTNPTNPTTPTTDLDAQRTSVLSGLTSISAYLRAQAISLEAL